MGDDLLVDFLRDRDTPCPACSYNLRDMTTSRCPECGHTVVLMLRPPERSIKAWVAALVVCCLGAGLAIVAMGAIATMSIGQGVDYAVREVFLREPAIGVAVAASLGAVALAIVVLSLRRRFVRMRRGAQWAIVACAVSYVLVVYAVFFVAASH